MKFCKLNWISSFDSIKNQIALKFFYHYDRGPEEWLDEGDEERNKKLK